MKFRRTGGTTGREEPRLKRATGKKSKSSGEFPAVPTGYDDVLTSVVDLLDTARRMSARAVNALMTAAYWEIGRRIVECEQAGAVRAEYGSNLLSRLSADLTSRFGRGFSPDNSGIMRQFYQAYSTERISETLSRKLPQSEKGQTPSGLLVESPGGITFQTPFENLDLRHISARAVRSGSNDDPVFM